MFVSSLKLLPKSRSNCSCARLPLCQASVCRSLVFVALIIPNAGTEREAGRERKTGDISHTRVLGPVGPHGLTLGQIS